MSEEKKTRDPYVTVRIPKELGDLIDEVIKSRMYGYRTRAELVKEAIRLRILDLLEGWHT